MRKSMKPNKTTHSFFQSWVLSGPSSIVNTDTGLPIRGPGSGAWSLPAAALLSSMPFNRLNKAQIHCFSPDTVSFIVTINNPWEWFGWESWNLDTCVFLATDLNWGLLILKSSKSFTIRVSLTLEGISRYDSMQQKISQPQTLTIWSGDRNSYHTKMIWNSQSRWFWNVLN